MLRPGLLLLMACVVACNSEGRWPGARDFEDPPWDEPDGGRPFPDAWPVEPDAGPFNGSNILRNSGFERLTDDASFAARWVSEASDPSGTISIDTAQTYTGQRALRYDLQPAALGYEFWVVQDGLSAEQLVPGGRYELSGFFRINQLDGESVNFNYILTSSSGDPDIANGFDNTHPVEVASWEPFAWQFTIPDDYSAESYSLTLHLIKFTSLRIVLWVDEVSLLRIQ